MKFLKFSTEAEAIAAFAQWAPEGAAFPSYIGTVAVDPVGVIHKPTGALLQDPDGNEYPEMAPTPGWHVNLSDSVPELAVFEIEAPATPARVFAGA